MASTSDWKQKAEKSTSATGTPERDENENTVRTLSTTWDVNVRQTHSLCFLLAR